jgi:hypothetical protein
VAAGSSKSPRGAAFLVVASKDFVRGVALLHRLQFRKESLRRFKALATDDAKPYEARAFTANVAGRNACAKFVAGRLRVCIF